MVTKLTSLRFIDKLYIGIILFVFGGIVLHAPATVWLGSIMPDLAEPIKAWKEMLILVALAISIYLMVERKRLGLLRKPIIAIMVGYGLLHLLYAMFSGLSFATVVAGQMIDLRYIAFFLIVFLASELYPSLRRTMLKVGLAGALVVFGFAILQVFVLPVDILSNIGYGRDTIVPYLTVDQNADYIRINSTLRGPNPLGAYAVVFLALMGSWLAMKRPKLTRKQTGLLTILILGAMVALWFSYSRSALLAFFVAFGLLTVFIYRSLITKKIAIGGISTLVALGVIFSVIFSGSTFVSNVFLHDNPADSSSVNSNEGHIESLNDGWSRMTEQPFGLGVGTTGSPSLGGDKPLIVENQYLYIAHETGWLGLVVFCALYVMLMRGLWRRRQDWLSLGLFFSGIGLAIIGLLLPVWVDDTVSIVWWGLAGIAIGSWKVANGEFLIANSHIPIASDKIGVEYKHRMSKKHGN